MNESIEPIIIDTEAYAAEMENKDFYSDASRIDNIYHKRERLTEDMHKLLPVDVTIVVVAYNRLEKTKRCLESILKYTEDIPYELYLIDNGSDDGTLEYFCSVPYDCKVVMRFTHNNPFILSYISTMDLGKYVVGLANDLIVTPGWLANMISCARSDPRIGLVQPASSNVSNLQDPGITYSSYDEMQRRAALFNRPDPRRWEERLRIITLGYLVKKEVLIAYRWPMQEMTFSYFADDDLAFMVRRLGYKVVLAGDTWICHDHPQTGIQADALEENRKLFSQKYLGIDAWEDVNNFWKLYLTDTEPGFTGTGPVTILGIDTRCGTPVLDIKNWLRSRGILETKAWAMTGDARYYQDLMTCCDQEVAVDQAGRLRLHFQENSFDYIVLDNPINAYGDVPRLLEDILSLCRPGGSVFLRLKNTFSADVFLHTFYRQLLDRESFYASISLDELKKAVGTSAEFSVLCMVPYPMEGASAAKLCQLIRPLQPDKRELEQSVNRLLTDCWILRLTKKGNDR